MRRSILSRRLGCVVVVATGMLAASQASAGVVFGRTGVVGGGYRWDAAPRIISGNERSLNGGLRYSVQGQSFQAYRDLFTWDVVPTVPAFTNAIQQAFNAWSSVDPVTGLKSNLSFVPDLATAPVGVSGGGVNGNGAEIDLLGSIDASFWNPGNTGTQGETWFNIGAGTTTLTSGTVGYAAAPISGVDITMNSNSGATYSLDLFRRILTHEIGHSIGLGDVENSINSNAFIDDNYDGTSSATIVATLNNSWASLVNTANPSLSPLNLYTVPNTSTATAGVDILMESFGVGISAANPVTNLVPLRNDDYGMRQFLYPYVPEPASLSALGGLAVAILRRSRGHA